MASNNSIAIWYISVYFICGFNNQKEPKIMKIIISYLKTESTWRGMVQVATAFGIVLQPAQAAAIIAGGTAIVGLINAFKKG